MKKTLIIMGTHPNGLKTFDWKRRDCEIWMFNEAPNFKNHNGKLIYPKCDVLLQLHHEAIWKNPKNLSDKDHYSWLASGKTPKVLMQEKYKDVPKSERYPIERVYALSDNVSMIINGKEKRVRYFSSTPDFAFALIADMWKKGKRYKQIEVHGIELEMESEYQYQRTGFGFWIGYLTALGVKIILYNSIFDAVIYGYEGDVAIPSKEFEKRIADLTKELGDDRDRYNQEAKNFLAELPELLKQNTSKSIQKKFKELSLLGEKAGTINGKIKENLRLIEKARAMEEAAGVSVFSVGEFDGSRSSFNKQFQQVRSEVISLSLQIGPLLKRLLNLKKRSHKRQRAIDEFGKLIVEVLNKNMLLFHIMGAIKESQYYIDSVKESYRATRGGKK